MNTPKWIVPLFVFSALYDGLLGLLFLAAPNRPFDWFDTPPPNHWGYVQFPAALLLIFGWIFLKIAWNPVAYRNLIPYGILLKVAYCGVSGSYWLTSGIPGMWKPFTVIDLAMGILFVCAYAVLGKVASQQDAEA